MSQKSLAAVAGAIVLTTLTFSVAGVAGAEGLARENPTAAIVASEAITAIPEFGHPGVVIPKSFPGISVEYGGSLEDLFNKVRLPITSRLLNRLGRLQGAPVLRIGGNSEDQAVWNLPALHSRPAGDMINLTKRVARMLRAVAVGTGGKLILGVNFGRGTAAMARPWMRNAIDIIGKRHILAFEIGNEPDLYNYNTMRPHSYNVRDYFRQWNGFASNVQSLLPQPRMLAGPAFCSVWRRYTPEFIQQQHRRLALVTMHEYPLGAPIRNRRSPRFASIANLLKNSSSAVFARLIRSSESAGRRYDIPVRFAEINSAYGGGKAGVSNVFAASLWSLDTMFEVASTGCAGVNFHTGPRYGAFWSFHHNGVRVLPLYYGMLMFAQAAPPGARIIPVAYHCKANVKIWMTVDRHREVRVVLINKSLHRNVIVALKLAHSQTGQLEYLTARSISSQKRIYIGGQSFDGVHDGILHGHRRVTMASAAHGIFTIRLHHASAVLMTARRND